MTKRERERERKRESESNIFTGHIYQDFNRYYIIIVVAVLWN